MRRARGSGGPSASQIQRQLQDQVHRQNQQLAQLYRDNARRQDALSAADLAVEQLSDRMERSLRSFSDENSVIVHSGVMPHERVAALMASDAAYDWRPFFQNSIDSMPAAEQAIGIPQGANAAYHITVRNLTDHEEYMFPAGVRNLDNWHERFLEHPIFRHINLQVDLLQFEPLATPSAHEAWTVTRFIKAGRTYEIVVTIVPLLHAWGGTSDHVLLYVRSPLFPMNQLEYRQMATTSNTARSIAGQRGIQILVQQAGFTRCAHVPTPNPSTTPIPAAVPSTAQASFLHGDAALLGGRRYRAVLTGGFTSTQAETNAGQRVLPLALQHLCMLLPALPATPEPVVYDIIQPHRYVYLFQIRSLGGWHILGAVNLHATHQAILSQFEVRDLRPLPLDPVIAGFAVPTTTEASRRFLALMDYANDANVKTYQKRFAQFEARERRLARPFHAHGLDTPALDQNMAYLPPDIWLCFLAHNGLKLLRAAFVLKTHAVRSLFNPQVENGDRVLAVSLDLLPKPEGTQKNDEVSVDLTLRMTTITVLFEVCAGLVEKHLKTLISSKVIGAKNFDDIPQRLIPFPIPQDRALAFPVLEPKTIREWLLRCKGLPPREWVHQMRPSDVKDLNLLMFLMHQGSVYSDLARLFLTKPMCIPPLSSSTTISQAIVQSINAAMGTVPMIKMAFEQCAYRATVKHDDPLRQKIKNDVIVVANAVAYLILSQDKALRQAWGPGA